VAEDPSSEPTIKNYSSARVSKGNIVELAAKACSLVLLLHRTIGYRGVLWRGGREWESNPHLPIMVLQSLGDQPSAELR
jgi:hypothetical protein